MAEAKTREKWEVDWWRAWWAADYSWGELRRKRVAGTGGLNRDTDLQAYWRTDPTTGTLRDDDALRAAGELVNDPAGRLWHIAHVPLHWADGTVAKSGWTASNRNALAAVVADRIVTAQQTDISLTHRDEETFNSPDGRAQLHGSVLLDPPVHPINPRGPIHLSAPQCWLPDWRPGDHHFGPGARFSEAAFAGGANFIGSSFAGDANFDGAVFAGDFMFEGATFLGVASFEHAAFAGKARFSDITFNGGASFKNAIFANHASFDCVAFAGAANFDHVTFAGMADFGCAKFNGSVRFWLATFAGDTSFFTIACTGHAAFGSATFACNADFHSAAFESVTHFDGAVFAGNANFRDVAFASTASFSGANFKKEACFVEAKFERCELDSRLQSGPMSFLGCIFLGRADFTEARFAVDPAHHSAAFLGARFENLVSFRGCGDYWVAALDEAEIKGRILVDERDEKHALADFDTIVLPRARAGGINITTGESLLKELEGGCRTIKVAMGGARNEVMEQRHYRFQLIARREQAGVPRGEKLVSHLFGFASDYGMSLWRPAVGLVAVLVLFSLVYAGFWIATGGFAWNDMLRSLEMAASRIFPFGAFDDVSKCWFIGLIERGVTTGTLIFARSLASLQSLIALLLIFLFGLAIRRRFKVGE
jgi:hypothetical protein